MTKIVDVEVTWDCRVELFPLEINRDRDECLVGRRGTGSYLAINEPGMRVIAMFRQNLSPAQIKDRLTSESADGEVALRGFLETLLAARFIRAVGGKTVEPTIEPRTPALSRLERRHIAWLFSWPMLALYALVIGAGAGLLIAHPHYVPRPAALLVGGSYTMTAAVAMLLMWANVVKHEAAHVVAGKFVGVDTYCSLGHRLFFPVLQADLTDLWLVGRAQRYIAYSAGIVSDLLVAAVVVIGLWLNDRGLIALGTGVPSVLRLLLVLVGVGILWQFNFFLRTDIYYILTTALGCRNLAADARARVMAGIRRRVRNGRRSPEAAVVSRHVWLLRVYAFVSLLGTGLLMIGGSVYLVSALRFMLSGTHNTILATAIPEHGSAARIVTGFTLLVNMALLVASMLGQRRRPQVTYRLIGPANL